MALASLGILSLSGTTSALDAEALAIPVCINQRCAVVDQNGSLLIPFDNNFDNIIAADGKNTIFAGHNEMWHLLSADGKKVLKADISDHLAPLTPNHFRFRSKGKIGIIRGDGKQIAPPKFDSVYVSGKHPYTYILYELEGKLGLMNAQGTRITQARFDTITSYSSIADRASLVTAANNDGRLWLIDLKSNRLSQAKFISLDKIEDGHLVVKSQNRSHTGLVNDKGQLVIDLKYYSLGIPSGGLVSFQEHYRGPCGYLDYKGKIAIPAQFSQCLPFGAKEALASERLANGSAGKFGPINRQGAWSKTPAYDKADLAGHTALGFTTQVKGLLSITQVDGYTAKTGIYDTDEGKEIIPMQYQWVSAINPDWFAFSHSDSPQVNVRLMGSQTMMPAVGIMNRNRQQLVAPSRFIHISMDASGRFFRALDGIDKQSKTGLYDLNGQLIVPPNWESLDIDERGGVIKAYEYMNWESTGPTLHALYNLQGQALLTVKTLACGAQQALNSAGEVIWPKNPEQYCPEKH